MGGKGVEPLRTFVHTVLSRTRLPFRHSPNYRYVTILRRALARKNSPGLTRVTRRRNKKLAFVLPAHIVHNHIVAVAFF